MGILGIPNRTENWKTVQHFYGLGDDAKVRLVRRLLKQLEEPHFEPDYVKIELFWKGMRDYVDQQKRNNRIITDNELASHYNDNNSEFLTLHSDIKEYNNRHDKRTEKFNNPKKHNYVVSDQVSVERTNKPTISTLQGLSNNLKSTEIDIVLETSSHLFIGEAKDVSSFDANSEYVLVHQLIREYVMASILVRLKNEARTVIPFIVGNSPRELMKKNQVKFMQDQGWLKDGNVLSWDEIKKLGGTGQ